MPLEVCNIFNLKQKKNPEQYAMFLLINIIIKALYIIFYMTFQIIHILNQL